MKKYFLIFGLFTCLFVTAQNKVDDQGLKQGPWERYFEDGQLRYKGQFIDDKEVGVFYFYNQNPKYHLAIKKEYDSSGNAYCEFYGPNDVLEAHGYMLGKNKINTWVYYDKGAMILQENYSNGVLEGVSKVFHTNGQVVEAKSYKKGKLDGSFLRYSKYGKVLSEETYVNNVKQGQANYYNQEGELILTGQYSNDSKTGVWKYFEAGQLQKEKAY